MKHGLFLLPPGSKQQSYTMSSYKSGRVSPLILPVVFVYLVSGVQALTVTPDVGATINISSTTQGKGCEVCNVSGSSQQCSASLMLNKNTSVSVTFTCSKPQEVFTVEVIQNIECKTSSFSCPIIQDDSGLQSLLDFGRRFTWNINAASPNVFKLDFTETGLRQIHPSRSCPDKHTYTLRSAGSVLVGKYCRSGTISSAQIMNQGSFSVDVPAGQKLQQGQFNVSVGEKISSPIKVSLALPKGNSSSELLSPNYPNSSPDSAVMEWSFKVPPKHHATVKFLSVTQPSCLMKTTSVEYLVLQSAGQLYNLGEPQPEQIQGSFSMTLRNCKMNTTLPGPGLSLNFTVSVSSEQVSCKVDLNKETNLSLHIINVSPDSNCEMRMNSVLMRNATVTSNAELVFQGCRPEDIRVTANGVVDCGVTGCQGTKVGLFVPKLPPCLPAPLTSVTWILRPSLRGTVALFSPAGPLNQALPGQPCNDSLIIKIHEEDGLKVGDFCHQGALQNIHIHSNVSVTLTSSTEGEELWTNYQPVLKALFEKAISENYIFNVSPSKDTPLLVATPGWPAGMKADSTVSWIITVPPNTDAKLKFPNLNQPTCRNGHTNIVVRRFGSPEEDYSRTEEEEADDEIIIPKSFYLNMSNCMPDVEDFSVITKITLQKRLNHHMIIILGVVVALLVILIILLVVICVIVRKKNQPNPQVSTYNSGDTNFLPGHNGFSETSPDSESNVYASIDDSLVYAHLLKKAEEIEIYKDNSTFPSFTGNVDAQNPSLFSSHQACPLPDPPTSHAHALVDNEIYQTGPQGEEERPLSLQPRLQPEGTD